MVPVQGAVPILEAPGSPDHGDEIGPGESLYRAPRTDVKRNSTSTFSSNADLKVLEYVLEIIFHYV